MRAKVTREALRWWRGNSEVNSISPGMETANRDDDADRRRLHAVLQEQLRPDVSPVPVPPPRMREHFAAAVAETLAGERQMAPPPKPRAAVVIRPKPIVRSRTIWLNGLTVLATGSAIVSDFLGLFSVQLTGPERTTIWVLLGVGVVNVLIRFETCYPIGNAIVYRSPIKAPTSSAARPLSGVIRDSR